jgi:hypothetical protein
MSEDVQFAKLDKDFAGIKDGTTLIQRCILSMACHFPNGLKYDNVALGKIFQVSPGRISHLVNDLDKKGFTKILLPQSKHRIIYLNPDHPTLLKIAKYHKELKELHSSKQPSTKCLHCYFELSTLLKSTNSIKEEGKNINNGTKVPGCKDNSFSASTPGETDTGFERFWAAYPRKEAKKDAQKAWKKLKPEPELIETILQAVERQKQTAQWQKDGGRFVPLPTTYLRGERWTDEIGGNGELVCRDATDQDVAMLEHEGIL